MYRQISAALLGLFLLFFFVWILGGPVVAQRPAGESADGAAALAVVTGYVDAWNAHDTRAIANLFADHADFTNPLGVYVSGRDKIENEHAKTHTTLFRATRMAIDSSAARLLSSDVALAHCWWTISGSLTPEGVTQKPFHGFTTFVAKKANGKWLIESEQVTLVGPPPPVSPSDSVLSAMKKK